MLVYAPCQNSLGVLGGQQKTMHLLSYLFQILVDKYRFDYLKMIPHTYDEINFEIEEEILVETRTYVSRQGGSLLN